MSPLPSPHFIRKPADSAVYTLGQLEAAIATGLMPRTTDQGGVYPTQDIGWAVDAYVAATRHQNRLEDALEGLFAGQDLPDLNPGCGYPVRHSENLQVYTVTPAGWALAEGEDEPEARPPLPTEEPPTYAVYRHYKGGLYQVRAWATFLDQSVGVVYRAVKFGSGDSTVPVPGPHWIRPLTAWLSPVESPNQASQPRFVPVA